jgi:hypothetical protein
MIWPSLGIDSITVALLVLGALPWFYPFLKSLEVPGVVKIELKDVKVATEKITFKPIAGTLAAREEGSDTAEITGTVGPPGTIATLQHIASREPNLALIGFRIEIEKRLLHVAEIKKIETSGMSLSQLIRELREYNEFSPQVASGLNELVAMGNRAAHGAEVSPEAAAWVLDIGPTILNQLDLLIQSADT